MVAAFKQFVGEGLYTVAEAALYARVAPPMMSRWLFGTTSAQSVIEPQFRAADHNDRRVTFLDLIQTLAIREMRVQRDVPLSKFRQAIKVIKETLGIDYPFARKHCTYLFGDEIVIRPPDTEDEFVQVSGRHKNQRLFPFVEMYLQDLTFNADGLANTYQVYKSHHDQPVSIKMDPQKRFGEPLLPSGYTALTIWDAIKAEGGIDPTAKAYGIPKEEVEAAYQFVVVHLGKSVA